MAEQKGDKECEGNLIHSILNCSPHRVQPKMLIKQKLLPAALLSSSLIPDTGPSSRHSSSESLRVHDASRAISSQVGVMGNSSHVDDPAEGGNAISTNVAHALNSHLTHRVDKITCRAPPFC